jgi:hypothetical protein
VGIASIIQRPPEGAGADVAVIVLTHEASEAALGRALAKIEALSVVRGRPRVIRIEEEV